MGLHQYLGIALFTVALAGCGGATPAGTNTGDAHEQSGEGMGDLSAYEGPISCDNPGSGEAQYNAMCNGCHTSYAPAMANLGWSAAAMRRHIREGEESMPAFTEDRLPGDIMECVLAHMVTMGAVTE